ncbi:MAG: HD domain-containing protein [Candidatus Omnitrophica bacterium]|nr:HD domain-containing protein [Candidatus Omnitrophota bacterium]
MTVLETLLKVSRKVSSSLELVTVSNIILKEAKKFLDTDFSALFLLDKEAHHLILIGAKGFTNNQLANLKVLAGWERINVELARKGKALLVNDIAKDARFKRKKIPFSKEKIPIGSFIAVPLKTGSKIIGVLLVSDHKSRKTRFTEADKKLLYALANHVAIALLNARLYGNTKALFLNTILSLAAAVDAKDPYTHGHSERVSKYALEIAREMREPEQFLEDLNFASILHDIGKIGISDSILSKKSALDADELQKMRKHPAIGYNIVKAVVESKNILNGMLEHHERFDGTGYPKKMSGNKISLEGRIIAVVDAFDTLTTNRPYQKAYTAKEAALEIVRSSGTQFDPRVIRAFQRSFSDNPGFWHFE